MKHLTTITLLLMITAGVLHGQNDPQYSLSSFNRLLYNPAAIAQSQYVDIRVSAREQWTGFEQAPATQSLSISNYFRDWRMGLGVSVVNDRLGVENIQNIKTKYAYHAWLAEDNYLSFGIGAGVMMKSYSSADLIFDDPNDAHITDGDHFKTKPDFDVGFEWHLKYVFIGAAVNHITQSADNPDILHVPRHHYAYAGVRLNAGSLVVLQPSLTVMNVENITSLQGEIMMNYDNIFWVGLGYRHEDAWMLSTKIMILDNLLAAYAYDIGAGELSSYREGSHEVMLHYRINKPQKHYRSPRFFD